MKLHVLAVASALAATLTFAGFVGAQQSGGVTSLRNAGIDETNAIEDVYRQDEGREPRNYRQQPPIASAKNASARSRTNSSADKLTTKN